MKTIKEIHIFWSDLVIFFLAIFLLEDSPTVDVSDSGTLIFIRKSQLTVQFTEILRDCTSVNQCFWISVTAIYMK